MPFGRQQTNTKAGAAKGGTAGKPRVAPKRNVHDIKNKSKRRELQRALKKQSADDKSERRAQRERDAEAAVAERAA